MKNTGRQLILMRGICAGFAAAVFLFCACQSDDKKSTPAPPGEPFNFAVISDTHVILSDDAEINDRFTAMGRLFSEMTTAPQFVVDTGDCVEDLFCFKGSCVDPLPILSLYRSLIEEAYPMPFYIALGNHDNRYLNTWVDNDGPRESWDYVFGDSEMLPAQYYYFDHNGFRMIVLFSSDLAHDHQSNDSAGFSDAQLKFLEKALAAGKPSVVFYHILIDPYEEIASDNPNPILDIFKKYKRNLVATFAGHQHYFSHIEWEGIDFYQTDTIKETTKLNYHLVRADPAGGTIEILNSDDIGY